MKKKRYTVISVKYPGIDYSKLTVAARKETDAYLNKEWTGYFCTCKKIPMCPLEMKQNGKLYNKKGVKFEHALDCQRNNLVMLDRIVNENFNPEKPLMKMDIDKFFGLKEERPKSVSVTRKYVSEYVKPDYYSGLAFARAIAVTVYSKLQAASKEFTCKDLITQLYLELNKMPIKDSKRSGLSIPRIRFNVGILESINKVDSETFRVVYSSKNKQYPFIIDKKSYDKAVKGFVSSYSKDIKPEYRLLFIGLVDDVSKRKKAFFYPVSNKGLLCDSFLEQRIYNHLENRIGNPELKDIVFAKKAKDCCYGEDDDKTYWVDDGELYVSSNKRRKVVLEIFGMMNKEEYAKHAEDKKKFFIDKEYKYYLLDIYPEDDLEIIDTKLIKAIRWLNCV